MQPVTMAYVDKGVSTDVWSATSNHSCGTGDGFGTLHETEEDSTAATSLSPFHPHPIPSPLHPIPSHPHPSVGSAGIRTHGSLPLQCPAAAARWRHCTAPPCGGTARLGGGGRGVHISIFLLTPKKPQPGSDICPAALEPPNTSQGQGPASIGKNPPTKIQPSPRVPPCPPPSPHCCAGVWAGGGALRAVLGDGCTVLGGGVASCGARRGSP